MPKTVNVTDGKLRIVEMFDALFLMPMAAENENNITAKGSITPRSEDLELISLFYINHKSKAKMSLDSRRPLTVMAAA